MKKKIFIVLKWCILLILAVAIAIIVVEVSSKYFFHEEPSFSSFLSVIIASVCVGYYHYFWAEKTVGQEGKLRVNMASCHIVEDQ
jgi:TRAP-type C4-dicarboxylate transport system permease small subunit